MVVKPFGTNLKLGQAPEAHETTYEASSPGERWVASLLDVTLLIAAVTLLQGLLHRQPLFFMLATGYFANLGSTVSIIVSSEGLFGQALFLLVAFPYFCVEGWYGASIGKILFSLRIAGRRTASRVIIRALIKSILPVSLVDFLFAFVNTDRNQRLSDKMMKLAIAKQDIRRTSRRFMIDKNDAPYLIVGIGILVLPLLSLIGYLALSGSPPVSTAPPPNSGQVFEVNAIFMASIMLNNLYLAYTFYVFGGLILCIPSMIQCMFQGLVSGVVIWGALESHWEFVILGVLPHMPVELAGYAFCIASGLVITHTLLDLVMAYRKGLSLESSRSLLAVRTIRILKLSCLGFVMLVAGAVVESVVTPFFLNAFYFN